jgi:hypothetical protein
VIICNRKKGHYSDRTICEMMTLNESHYNPAASTSWSVVCLVLKSPQTQNMLLHIEFNTHHKQVKVVHIVHRKGKLTITNSKSSRLSYSVFVRLPLESRLSKIYRYKADFHILWYYKFIRIYQVDIIIVKIMIID